MCGAEDVPPDAVTASLSLDDVMVALRAGEDGCADACWREASCGTVSFNDAQGKRLKTLYLGRMPESGEATLKAQLASEVAHIRRVRPEIRIGAVADGAAGNWTVLEGLSPETKVIDFWHACEHLRVASDHAVAPRWFEKRREVLRHDPRGAAKVVRALCYLCDTAKPDRAEIERKAGLLPRAPPPHAPPRLEGRGHRHRLGRSRGAACETLVAQCLKRSSMCWPGRRWASCSDLPGLDQIEPLRPGMGSAHGRSIQTGQRQHQPNPNPANCCLNSVIVMRDSHPLEQLLFKMTCIYISRRYILLPLNGRRGLLIYLRLIRPLIVVCEFPRFCPSPSSKSCRSAIMAPADVSPSALRGREKRLRCRP